MKGALSSVDYLFSLKAHQQLHPDTTYQHVSGGDPVNIPDLSWEQPVTLYDHNLDWLMLALSRVLCLVTRSLDCSLCRANR
jgi:hypothetical protein